MARTCGAMRKPASCLCLQKACVPLAQVVAHKDTLAPGNALDLVQRYDVVVDASDNAPTRYLLSDACVVAGRPLVSGAALGTDGQVTVYNQSPDGATATPQARRTLG